MTVVTTRIFPRVILFFYGCERKGEEDKNTNFQCGKTMYCCEPVSIPKTPQSIGTT
jgi:hypothetical protein